MPEHLKQGAIARGPNSDLTQRTADFIARRVKDGVYTHKLPGVHALAAELGINFLTVNKAMDQLARLGTVYRIPRSGTYVSLTQKPLQRQLSAVLGGVGGPIHASLLRGIQQQAFAMKQHLLLGANLEWIQNQKALEWALAAEHVDGVVLWPQDTPGSETAAEWLCRRGMPCVLVMGVDPAHPPSQSFVCNNDEWGVAALIHHLLGLGRKEIAFLDLDMHTPLNLSASIFSLRRRQAYERALEAAGLTPAPEINIPIEVSSRGSTRLGPLPMHRLKEYDALFCLHDGLAIEVMRQLREAGVRVPEDIAVAGFDDTPGSEAARLSTVRQPFEQIGRESVRLLVEQIEGRRTEPEHLVLQPELIVRASTTGEHSAAESNGAS